MKKFLIYLSVMLSIALVLVLIMVYWKNEDTYNDDYSEVFNNWYDVRARDCAIFRDNGGDPSLIDYKTLNSSVICNIPNCSHNTNNCLVALLKGSDQLPVLFNREAYFFENSTEFVEKNGKIALDLNFKLKKYNFDNCRISDVAEVKGFNANTDGGCYLIGSDYYFTTNTGNPLYDELGNVTSTSTSGGGNLFCINLDTGKVMDYGQVFDYESLKKEYPSVQNSLSMYLMGKIDNKLYISVNYMKMSITPEMLQIGETPIWNGETYVFDITIHKIDKLDDEFSMCSMNDYHSYFTDNQNKVLTLKNVKTGEIYNGPDIVSWNAMTIFDDKVWHDDAQCYDIKTGKNIKVLSYDCGYVIAKYENSYIFKCIDDKENIVFEKIPCEEIDSLFE